ncbi:MAG: hypothetical protein GTO18_09460 [Anaerolineales bacterium]|nr:hypothetical protein [Anaerolineales bacterium]
MLRKTFSLSALILLALLISASGVTAHEAYAPTLAMIGTSFTYQGTLTDGGSPANGEYDFQFILYDAVSGGSQVGSITTKEDVDVIDGLFTVELDFGDIFDGTALWLEIGVRPGSSVGFYSILSPRNKLTPSPYAIYATNGDLLDGQHGSFYRNASNINAGTLNNGRFSAYSDLSSEGRLDNNASDDLLTRSQADGRYVNEGQSSSVTSAMIVNAAQTAAGTANIYGFTTSSSVVEMDSFEVNVPGPGQLTVFVMGSTWLNCDSTSSSSRLCTAARLAICDTSASYISCGSSLQRIDFEDPDNVDSTNEEHWLVLGRSVNVASSGPRTFYLNGMSHEEGMQFQINGYMIAIFTPNSLGVTTAPLFPSLQQNQ